VIGLDGSTALNLPKSRPPSKTTPRFKQGPAIQLFCHGQLYGSNFHGDEEVSKRPPAYKEYGKSYHADTCQSLVAASRAGKVRLKALARGSYPGVQLHPSALQGLSSIGYWDAAGKQDWGLDWHRNEGIELTFLETGSLPFSVHDQDFRLKPGDLTITRPWQPHRVGNPHLSAGKLHWVILDVKVRRPNQPWQWPEWLVLTRQDLKELTNILRHNEHPVWPASTELKSCFQKLARTLDASPPTISISRLTAYLNELFVLLLELLRQQEVKLDSTLSSTLRTVSLFLDDLRENREYLAQPWTIETMAHQCGLGETRFLHYCRELTNLTPIRYLNQCRVETAARLLVEQPQRNVTEVAFDCGFSSSQYFATVFVQHFQCTPSQYRRVKLS